MQDEARKKQVQELKMTGLGDKAAIIYTVLLELGGAHPSKIAEEAGMNRSTTYKILLDLSVQGLVRELRRSNKLYYQIENPKKLTQFAKDQIRLSENRYEKAVALIPELEGIFNVTPNKPRVRFFEGEKEIVELYGDHVDVKRPYEMLAFSNASNIAHFLPRDFRKNYISTKNRLGITTRGIIPDTKENRSYNETVYGRVKKSIVPELRFIPTDLFPFKAELTIYGEDKISIQNFDQAGLIGVIIEDKTIHGMMKMIFELAWVGAEALYRSK